MTEKASLVNTINLTSVHADIIFASGAVHDDYGPITSLVPMTESGRDWLKTEMDADLCNGAVLIETDQIPLILDCIQSAGLSYSAA